MNRIRRIWHVLLALTYRRICFRSFGPRSFIVRPIQIINPRYIKIGNRVRIQSQARLEALDKFRVPLLEIGDNCNIEQNVHIICSNSVKIGPNCSITARCSIVDTWHPYSGIGADAKIGEALNRERAFVEIGDNCFLGIGSVVMPNVRLGRRCVVGANSVVRSGEYADGSVLAGVPARVIKVVAPQDY